MKTKWPILKFVTSWRVGPCGIEKGSPAQRLLKLIFLKWQPYHSTVMVFGNFPRVFPVLTFYINYAIKLDTSITKHQKRVKKIWCFRMFFYSN